MLEADILYSFVMMLAVIKFPNFVPIRTCVVVSALVLSGKELWKKDYTGNNCHIIFTGPLALLAVTSPLNKIMWIHFCLRMKGVENCHPQKSIEPDKRWAYYLNLKEIEVFVSYLGLWVFYKMLWRSSRLHVKWQFFREK